MNKKKIMIVKDEAIVAKDLSRQLTDLGYDVVATAYSGEEALEKVREAERLGGVKLTIYQTYPEAAYGTLKKIECIWPIADIVLQHREYYDGSGFPRRIKGDEILIDARILSVAVALEDLTTHRSYRNAFSLDQALETISSHSGSEYDPEVVAACLRLFTEKGYTIEKTDASCAAYNP